MTRGDYTGENNNTTCIAFDGIRFAEEGLEFVLEQTGILEHLVLVAQISICFDNCEILVDRFSRARNR